MADDLMTTVMRLQAATETLAAIGATLRMDLEGLDVPDEIATRLREIALAAGVDTSSAPLDVRRALSGLVRAYFLQSMDLLTKPDRPGGWVYDDPILLQSQGRASMTVPQLLPTVVPQLEGLAASLDRNGAAMLDVGTGVGWLAIGAARTYAKLRVVGLDIWDPALALARENVAGSDVADRVELRKQDVVTLDDRDAFDLAWVPGPFLPHGVVTAALPKICAAVRPGGWVLFGLFGGPEGMEAKLFDLRTIRSGGHPWHTAEAIAMLEASGFTDVREVPRTWGAPLRFIAGRR